MERWGQTPSPSGQHTGPQLPATTPAKASLRPGSSSCSGSGRRDSTTAVQARSPGWYSEGGHTDGSESSPSRGLPVGIPGKAKGAFHSVTQNESSTKLRGVWHYFRQSQSHAREVQQLASIQSRNIHSTLPGQATSARTAHLFMVCSTSGGRSASFGSCARTSADLEDECAKSAH